MFNIEETQLKGTKSLGSNNFSDEKMEQLLGIDVICKTNKTDRRVLHFWDFKNEHDSSISLNTTDNSLKAKNQIILTINCDGYSVKIE